ncbi:phosphoglycerate dehydrogenase family protein [Deltaproteobacteria bacterium Smac51]|nr:phosphoglycerate dehydrogenase family protein [Deltaproteobacteria bacterium Smac51]
MKPLIWIIDEEWPDYEVEREILRDTFPDCRIEISAHDYQADLEKFGVEAEAIICQIYVNLPREVIERLTVCRCISVYGGGYERVDIEAARERGIKVTNVAGYCNEDVTDYVMAAIYHFYKNLAALASTVAFRPWGARAVPVPPQRLSQSNLHIIGLGRIGQELAAKAGANGLKVTAYDPYVPAEVMAGHGVRKTEWEEGLAGADYISVHMALNEHTTGLLKYEDFKKMKPTAVLINAARGRIIDEEGVARALAENLIRGVMLDTLSIEPPTGREAILSLENAVVTPHISYISVQSFEELKRRAARNVVIGLLGGNSPDLVNG